MKILIATVPFGEKNSLPIEMLKENNIEYVINPLNKKFTEDELCQYVDDVDIIIAGTEPITKKVLEKAKKLKLISRVGIGLDSVDLIEAKKRGVIVSYTPEAPGPAVAELTMGLMLSLLRQIHVSNLEMHRGNWNRYFGRRIAEVTIGVIGVGRIGARVLNRIAAFGTPRLLLNDVVPNQAITKKFKVEWVSKDTIYKEADVISIHVPLTAHTKNMISTKQMDLMKSDALLINTSRGGIVNEQDLYIALKNNKIGGAAIDVFEEEPYVGALAKLDNCILTSHMGSMSVDCRTRMEIEATEEAVRFVRNLLLQNEVPEAEYQNQEC